MHPLMGNIRVIWYNHRIIYFDIVFYAKLPQNGKIIKFLINLEALKDIPKTYPLMKRVEYYGCRLVSSQKERDFEKSDYGRGPLEVAINCIFLRG